VGVVTESGALGNIRRGFDGLFGRLFTMYTVNPRFPFIFAGTADAVFTGHMVRQPFIGVMALPLLWFLAAAPFGRKSPAYKEVRPIVLGMVAVSLITIIFTAVTLAMNMRYAVDFFWLLIIAANLCMGAMYAEALEKGQETAALVGKLHFAAALFSSFILFCWGMVGERNLIEENNPALFRYLTDTFIIF
jgi:hypothetical protein